MKYLYRKKNEFQNGDETELNFVTGNIPGKNVRANMLVSCGFIIEFVFVKKKAF